MTDDQSTKYIIPKEAFDYAMRCGTAETVVYGVKTILQGGDAAWDKTSDGKLLRIRELLNAAGFGII